MTQPIAKVVEHSISQAGKEIVTLQLAYPRFIHAEFMTHRVFSRNAASSRAIPVAKMLEQVRNNPAMPLHWGKNQPGMQAKEEHGELVLLDLFEEYDNPSDVPLFTSVTEPLTAEQAWREAARRAADVAEAMMKAGYHKQVVNRLLEPFQMIHVIVTATEWDNFYELRDHPDAQPEIQALARVMRAAVDASTPVLRGVNLASAQNWHLPYVTAAEREAFDHDPYTLAKFSSARCARVSYLNHDGTEPNQAKDLELHEKLAGSAPLHASPIEHQAYPGPTRYSRSRNFVGWKQFREMVEMQPIVTALAGTQVDHEGSTCD